jgi:hypothetical protein
MNRSSLNAIRLGCAAAVLLLAARGQAQVTVSSDPANGATGVSPTAPVVFTFSGPLDTTTAVATFYSISPPGSFPTTLAWNSGNTQLTCTPTPAFPTGQNISWLVSGQDTGGLPVFAQGSFTTGTDGGTTDTNPPVLVSSIPANNATGVPLNWSVQFTFNEPMQASHSIQWSANLTPSSFWYNWSADAKTLICGYSPGFPANATITWTLNPSGSSALFKDAAGNALATSVYTGSFTTSNTNDLCNPEPGDMSLGSFFLSRQVSYLQTGSGAPVLDTNTPPLFNAVLTSPTNANPVTSAQLDVPGGGSHDLTNLFGRLFFAYDQYATQAELDASRPPGTYTLHVNRTTGGPQSLTRSLQASDWPPIPQILNLPALQNVDPTSDMLVQWNGFSGAGAGDSIFFSLSLNGTQVYHAPDPCVPVELDKAATFIIVPKAILEANKTYEASLGYIHTSAFDTNSIPDIFSSASTSKYLSFPIVTAGGAVSARPPMIGSLSLNSQGLQSQITGAAPGQSLQVQQSTTLLPGSWVTVQTNQADAAGTAHIVFPFSGSGRRFFRLYTP